MESMQTAWAWHLDMYRAEIAAMMARRETLAHEYDREGYRNLTAAIADTERRIVQTQGWLAEAQA